MKQKIKKCKNCNKRKKLHLFPKHKRCAGGYNTRCKACVNRANREYKLKNKEKVNKSNNTYREKNKEKIKTYRKKHYVKNREKIRNQHNIYVMKRYNTDPNFKISCLIRNRLRNAISRNQKVGSSVKDLGCSTNELKDYLENKFKKGMSWENHGDWHIDHIIPLASFDLTDREQFLRACHYTNLQPLWEGENLSKRSKVIQP